MSLDTRTLEVLISRVCHDLISPISAVSNGAELIADMGLASEAGLQYGDKARSLLGRARDKQLTAEMFAMQRSNLDQTEQHSATRLAAAAKLLPPQGHEERHGPDGQQPPKVVEQVTGAKAGAIGSGLLQETPQRVDLFGLQQPLLFSLFKQVAIQMHGGLR